MCGENENFFGVARVDPSKLSEWEEQVFGKKLRESGDNSSVMTVAGGRKKTGKDINVGENTAATDGRIIRVGNLQIVIVPSDFTYKILLS